MNKHARLSPSDHAWVHCPGKVREASGYEDLSSPAAIDGTGSHELLEKCLVEGVRAEKFIGTTVSEGHEDMPMGWYVDILRAERVQMCLDYVGRRFQQLSDELPNCTIHLTAEERVTPGQLWHPPREDSHGAADTAIHVLTSDAKQAFLEVIDCTGGRMYGDVNDTSQLASYWIGGAYETGSSLPW